MKEIRYRVWSIKHNSWMRSVILSQDGTPLISFVEINEEAKTFKNHLYVAKDQELVIQQFTGLLDKDGKEIYEGDAVFSNDDEEVYTVVFHKGMFCVRYTNGTFAPLYEFSEVAVCGNIFEP